MAKRTISATLDRPSSGTEGQSPPKLSPAPRIPCLLYTESWVALRGLFFYSWYSISTKLWDKLEFRCEFGSFIAIYNIIIERSHWIQKEVEFLYLMCKLGFDYISHKETIASERHVFLSKTNVWKIFGFWINSGRPSSASSLLWGLFIKHSECEGRAVQNASSTHRLGSGSCRVFTWAHPCFWKSLSWPAFSKKRQKTMTPEQFLTLPEVDTALWRGEEGLG